MAWCSFKAQGNFTFTFYHLPMMASVAHQPLLFIREAQACIVCKMTEGTSSTVVLLFSAIKAPAANSQTVPK
jgi:hypothetical protein